MGSRVEKFGNAFGEEDRNVDLREVTAVAGRLRAVFFSSFGPDTY